MWPRVRQLEGAFSQPNAGVCERMLEWAHDATRGSQAGDLLELYCGAPTVVVFYVLALLAYFVGVTGRQGSYYN